MRYIRFLKPPKTDGKSVKALVTITSDLGDSFLAEDAALTATLLADAEESVQAKINVTWKAGMRSLPVVFDLPPQKLNQPLRVHVGLQDRPESDHFSKLHAAAESPCVISAWSQIINFPKHIIEAEKLVERKFIRQDDRRFSIWEETGESIARHVW